MFKRRKKKRRGIDVGKFGWTPQYLKTPVYAITSALVVCLFVGAGVLDRFVKETGSPYMAAVISAVLVDLANADRADAQMQQLRINPKLVAAAQAKANDMASKGYFSHTTPEGYDSWHWFRLVNYDYAFAGENLAVNFSESTDVEKAWMNSPTHRANIVNEHYTEIGIATAKGMYRGQEAIFAVQMFGRPSAVEVARAVGAPLPSQQAAVAQATSSQVLGEAVATEEEPTGALLEQDGDAQILTPEQVPWWAWIAVQPKTTLRYAYLIIGLLILAALFGDMEWEIKQHHMRHAMKAGAVLATMSMLFIVADWLFFAEPILAAVAQLIP